VHIGEALGLLVALNWVHEVNLGPVEFELDSKRVVDSFHSSKCAFTEFGVIVEHCKSILFFPTIIETQMSSLCRDKQIRLHINLLRRKHCQLVFRFWLIYQIVLNTF
jgi:hypothetical protein